MFEPLQVGVPGGTELLIVVLVLIVALVIPAVTGYWIGRDANRRGSDHHVAWGTMTFLSGLFSFVPFLVFVVFYVVVRDDIGSGD